MRPGSATAVATATGVYTALVAFLMVVCIMTLLGAILVPVFANTPQTETVSNLWKAFFVSLGYLGGLLTAKAV